MQIPRAVSDNRCGGLLDVTNSDCVDWAKDHNNGATGDPLGAPITGGSISP